MEEVRNPLDIRDRVSSLHRKFDVFCLLAAVQIVTIMHDRNQSPSPRVTNSEAVCQARNS